jgi:hypothetical protein
MELNARSRARNILDDEIAELDRTEPRWRLEDVEANRSQIPGKQNSAPVTVAVFSLLPKNWNPAVRDELEKLPPPLDLSAERVAKLIAELNGVEPALRKARELKDMPIGRHKIQYAPDWIGTLIPDQQNVRESAKLLDLDVCRAALGKEMSQAWESNRALLNCGRSLGDEPLLISSLIRLAIDAMAVNSLERTLALAEFPLDHLQERQKALEEESSAPLFMTGIRGERAGCDFLLTNIETGKIRLLRTLNNVGRRNKTQESDWWDDVSEFFAYSMVLNSHATILRFETAMIGACELPPGQRLNALLRIEASIKSEIAPGDRSQIMARLLLPAVVRVAEAEARVQSHLACGVAGLAAERYRLLHGRWPNSLDELAQAGNLKSIPLDHFDGNPLRFRRTADGIVIYSIGRQGSYDGKALDDLASFDPEAQRTEFRLWDLDQRRQPAKDDKSTD